MKSQDRLILVCGGFALLTVLLVGSAQAAPLGAIAEETLEPSQLVLEPLFDFDRAALTVEGPAGYVAERTFGPGEAVRLALSDGEGAALPDGRYRYSLRLTPVPADSSDVQNGLFFVDEGSGVSRTERRDQLASIRETLNQERERRFQPPQRAAPISPDEDGVTGDRNPLDDLSMCARKRCCRCPGDFALGGSITKEGKPFLHNYGGHTYGNTALGLDALLSVSPSQYCDWGYCYFAGAFNTAVGQGALNSNTTGPYNTASGVRALASNTTGAYNTATGADALRDNTTGSTNTASGTGALLHNTTGDSNTATGFNALFSNTTGTWNIATGRTALYFNTTGSGNVATGGDALRDNTTGFWNTACGDAALLHNTTGFRNVGVGYGAGRAATTGSDNIFLGSGAEGVAGEANTIRIGGATGTGDNQQNRAFIAGIRGITPEYADAVTVVIDSAGQLGTVSSSRHVKEEIRDMDEASSRFLELRPVTFRHRQQKSVTAEKPLSYGLIAEEVAEVFPELVTLDEQGQPEAVLYRLLTPMLLNELQKQTRLNQEQQAEIESLEAQLAPLRHRLAVLEATMPERTTVVAGPP